MYHHCILLRTNVYTRQAPGKNAREQAFIYLFIYLFPFTDADYTRRAAAKSVSLANLTTIRHRQIFIRGTLTLRIPWRCKRDCETVARCVSIVSERLHARRFEQAGLCNSAICLTNAP